MKYKLRLIIIGVILLCLLPAVAPGDSCIKSLYVDGVYKGSVTATAMLSREFDRLTIGANGDYLDPNLGLVGQMDEFAVYHGILPDPCIAWHASFSQDNLDYVNAVKHDNPLLYFQFEETDSNNGATVINYGSVDVNGTYIGDAIIGDPNLVAGYMGKCVEFYGTQDYNGTCIDVCDWDYALFPEDGNVTVEFWANVPSPNHGETEFWFQHTDTYGLNGYGAYTIYWHPEEDANFWYNYMRGGGSAGFVDFNTCEAWKHIVFTFESATTYMGDYYTEVNKDDPCLWIRFEESDPCDWSGHEYWVEFGSETSVGSEGGGIGGCIYLPGTDESYVAAANQDTEPNDDPCFAHKYAFTPSDITWEFWYRGQDIPALPDYAMFFNQSDDGERDNVIESPNYEMAGRVGGGGGVYSRYRYNHPEDGPGYANQNPDMQIPLDDGWHHIVVSWGEMIGGNNTMSFRLCIDGVSVKGPVTYPDTSPQQGKVGGNIGEMDHIVIGAGGWRDAAGTGASLIGYMDEFAIYGGVLPPARVIAHYDAGRPKNCKEIWDRGLPPDWAKLIDRNQNCLVEFIDYALFAEDWAFCNDPTRQPECTPPKP